MTMTLLQTYTSDPADSDPNTGGVSPGDAQTFHLPGQYIAGSVQGGVQNISCRTEGVHWKYIANAADIRVTVVWWKYDATGTRWDALAEEAGVERDQLFETLTAPGDYYPQLTKTAGTTVGAAPNDLHFYAEPA